MTFASSLTRLRKKTNHMRGRWLRGVIIRGTNTYSLHRDGRWEWFKLLLGVMLIFVPFGQVFDPEKNYGQYKIA
jgi:hypothetical protein